MGKGQKLYIKAKTLIPGGTMLLSKRPEMFLPEKWPSYFSKAKGCKVWDLDGNEFIDILFLSFEQTKDKEIAKLLDIEYWTTIVVYKGNKEISRTIGQTKKSEIYSQINSL